MAEAQNNNGKIPVTILTGFLGSGKTTLLNWILSADHKKKLAVIENEFGETGVDEEVLVAREHSDEIMIEVKNGCICCTVRGDLVESLSKLYAKTNAVGKPLDGVIIETTGLADPAPVCQSFFVEKKIADKFEIDAVLTVVDAKHIIQHLNEVKPKDCENEAEEQLAFADKIMLNKIDLVPEEKDLQAIEERIKSINKYAKIFRTQFSKEAPKMDQLLGLKAFDLDRVVEMDEGFLDEDAEHVHDDRVSSVGFVLDENQQINLFKLQNYISYLLQKHNEDLFRYKGVIAVKGQDQKYVFQGVHMLFGGDFAAPWGDQPRKSVFCFIGKNLKTMDLKKGFMNCIAQDLRFKIGQKVKANVANGFTPGQVVKLWDQGNAYRVRLCTGIEVWAPIDDDRFILAD
jgi:G3E family GTPase